MLKDLPTYVTAAEEARKFYISTIFRCGLRFQVYADRAVLTPLAASQPARAALMKEQQIFISGNAILATFLYDHNALSSDYMENRVDHPSPVIQSIARLNVAIEMQSRELDSYRAALIHCRLANEIDSYEFNLFLKHTAKEAKTCPIFVQK